MGGAAAAPRLGGSQGITGISDSYLLYSFALFPVSFEQSPGKPWCWHSLVLPELYFSSAELLQISCEWIVLLVVLKVELCWDNCGTVL